MSLLTTNMVRGSVVLLQPTLLVLLLHFFYWFRCHSSNLSGCHHCGLAAYLSGGLPWGNWRPFTLRGLGNPSSPTSFAIGQPTPKNYTVEDTKAQILASRRGKLYDATYALMLPLESGLGETSPGDTSLFNLFSGL